MRTRQGKSVYKGIAIGKILIHRNGQQVIKRRHIDDTEAEIRRFQEAREKALKQLGELYDKALAEVGEANAAIFEVHQMMLEDLDYEESILNIIKNQELNAEYAVASTGENFSEMFAAMDDDYMRGRAADVKDVSERLVRILTGVGDSKMASGEPVIIVADDLAPSETIQLDKSKVLAFVTRHGSVNSHTAILARMMNIPALIGVDYEEDWDGALAVVDGSQGMIYVEPTKEVLDEKRAALEEQKKKEQLLQKLKGEENITLDGRKINIYANIGNVSDLGAVLQNDAGGIGLFRSEFLYLERSTYPTEEEQFLVYKRVAETMGGRKVIIRTLDIGADKQADYFNIEHEENPAMGYRAIRICLDRVDIFKTQLRALYRASMFGNLSIMFPMIISVEEVKRIKEIVEEVKEELRRDQVPHKEDVEIGIMIETPAAVMVSDQLAQEVDFFSVGTNDLTQYTLAIDRQNPKLDNLYVPDHPAIMRMLKIIADNGHKGGCWVGICGELAANLDLTEQFLKMGYDELSVSPTFVLPLRQKVRESRAYGE